MTARLFVHIHTGVNEMPQWEGKRANVSHMSAGIAVDDFHVAGYWKLLRLKPLTLLTLEWQIMNTQMPQGYWDQANIFALR